MNKKEIYKYLTPAAQEELAEKVNDFENNVVTKAYEIASRNQESLKEISLSDILKATTEPIYREKNIKNESSLFYKKERFYRLISLSGILYAFIGIGIYLYQNDFINLKASSGLIITAVGIVLALSGLVLKSSGFGRSKQNLIFTSEGTNFDIVERWQKLEKLALDKTENIEGRGKFSSVKEFYRNILDDKDYIEFRRLLDVRNRILHENYKPTRTTYDHFIELSEKLLDIAEKAESKNTMAKNGYK
ncbi:hypothetical protein [Flagellimonas halotolerans]|uniref:Uncharacterized protein n=1 Tax=Flagellimonas halotolerans TaxID=3112164 RepID=A0ABU6IQV0_9FLAO|nr:MULTISPECIES: hypothetical protein [unclassified Allomuricauda]MEC3965632.1 hypothetical protein [Muricauda sp. SYSU M86414]MEC4265499.1 hypothetical protein [Muricauda sp. SYSU M84420]